MHVVFVKLTSLQVRVIRRGFIVRELLSIGCYLEAHGYLSGKDFMGCKGLMVYCTRKWLRDILLRDYDSVCAMTLAVLLVIDGVEKSPGPVVEAENIKQVLCSGCNRNLKLGAQFDVWTLVP